MKMAHIADSFTFIISRERIAQLDHSSKRFMIELLLQTPNQIVFLELRKMAKEEKGLLKL